MSKNNNNNKKLEIDKDVLCFSRGYNHISPVDLEEILEHLSDSGFLSEEGQDFWHRFWETYIKE